MKEIKYVIKDINSNKYLSPYIYGKHWVGIEYAQRYNVNIKKENNILDFVDRIWIEDKEVKLVKVKVEIKVEEVIEEEKTESIKKEYIVNKAEYKLLKDNFKKISEVKYNEYGTKLKPLKTVHHIIYNLIKDNYYLKGFNLSRNKFLLTHESILSAKKIILSEDIKKEIEFIFGFLIEDEKIKKIQNKLKKQIEN